MWLKSHVCTIKKKHYNYYQVEACFHWIIFDNGGAVFSDTPLSTVCILLSLLRKSSGLTRTCIDYVYPYRNRVTSRIKEKGTADTPSKTDNLPILLQFQMHSRFSIYRKPVSDKHVRFSLSLTWYCVNDNYVERKRRIDRKYLFSTLFFCSPACKYNIGVCQYWRFALLCK